MSNKTSKTIAITNETLKSIVDELLKKDYNPYIKIEDDFENLLIKTNDIINSLSSIIQYDYQKRKKELESIKYKSKNILKKCEYLINNQYDDIDRDLEKITKLSHNYYRIENLITRIENSILSENLDKIQKINSQLNEKTKKLDKKLGGIIGTVVSIILSVSFVSSTIIALDKIKPVYIPILLIGMIWIGMTLILFINGIFNEEIKIKKAVWYLYFMILGILTITLLVTLSLVYNNPNLIS